MPGALAVSSYGHRTKVPQSDQVVGGHREGEHPPDAGAASESRLAAQPDGLQPAEHFLDALAQSLAHPVPSVARGARVERRDLLLGHVRSHVERAETLDEVGRRSACPRRAWLDGARESPWPWSRRPPTPRVLWPG